MSPRLMQRFQKVFPDPSHRCSTRGSMLRIRRILVPIDTTKLTDRVMDTALTMAERFGARIRVLFVRDEQGPLPDDEQEVEMTIEGLRRHVRDHAKKGGHSVPASSIEAELRTG